MRERLIQIRSIVDELLRELGDAVIPAGRTGNPDPDEFGELRRLLESPEWPEAVPPSQIADRASESDKEERARSVCDIMLPPLVGKKFLDYGCGEGHLARLVAREASLSVGYDIARDPKSQIPWEDRHGFLLTTDMSTVESLAPFDAILMYDLIDHVQGESPEAVLRRASNLLSDKGRIYVRCHPWCSRHGGHLYRFLNKAFVHLVFTDEELRLLGAEPQHCLRFTRPVSSYGHAIDAAGLKQDAEPEADSQEVEEFFRATPAVARRILGVWGVDEWGRDPPAAQMSQCFLDYVLVKK